MSNLSRTLFGRLYALKPNTHFFYNYAASMKKNHIYVEEFKFHPYGLITGKLYYYNNHYNRPTDTDNSIYSETSRIEIRIGGTKTTYLEERRQSYFNTKLEFEYNLMYCDEDYKGFREMEFEKIPKRLLQLLESKTDEHIIDCSCCDKTKYNYY